MTPHERVIAARIGGREAGELIEIKVVARLKSTPPAA
jgi:hypothetical protein